jgi:hypothetical protein
MESASTVISGAEPTDRGRFTARIMGNSVSSEIRKSHESGDHHPAGGVPSPVDSTTKRPGANGTYTLRIKPDRRREQAPIAPGSDRRRSR